MGSRRGTRQGERDEGDGALLGTITLPKPQSVEQRVLSWQQSYGNKAVTSVLQRRPDRPQSTDAPGARRRPPAKGSTEDYAPTASNPKYANTSDAELMNRGNEYIGQDAANNVLEGVSMLEELWFRKKDVKPVARGAALNISRGYDKLGDQKRASWWKKVHTGEITPGVEADGSKEHA